MLEPPELKAGDGFSGDLSTGTSLAPRVNAAASNRGWLGRSPKAAGLSPLDCGTSARGVRLFSTLWKA
jgi:hypothetical protein